MNIPTLSVDVCIVKAIFLYVNAQMYVIEQSHLPLTVKKLSLRYVRSTLLRVASYYQNLSEAL